MRAGAMKYRLKLLRPAIAANKYGEEATTYDEVRTIHAERVKHTGRRSEEVGEHFADYSVSYNIRSAHPVKEGWRVQQVGEYVYTVISITPNIDVGMLTLHCERLNE